MPADMKKFRIVVNFERVVKNKIDVKGFGKQHCFALKSNKLRLKFALQLPQRPKTVRVRSRKNLDAAKICNKFQRVRGVPARRFKRDVARLADNQITGRTDADLRRVRKSPNILVNLPPTASYFAALFAFVHFVRARKTPTVFGQSVSHVRANRTQRRNGKIFLPVAAVVAGIMVIRHRSKSSSCANLVRARTETVFRLRGIR